MNHRPFTLSDAARGVARRKKLVAGFFVATCVLVGMATLLASKTYKSEARLFMRLGRENTSVDATTTLGEHPVVMLPQSREAEINSIVELIQAKQLYESVVDAIGPDRILTPDWTPEEAGKGVSDSPSLVSSAMGSVMNAFVHLGILNDLPKREKAVIKLQKKVEIEAFEKSNVLTVSFISHSPELAQDVVDRLLGFYQTHHVNLHRPPRAFEFLERETQRIEQGLTEARIALEGFKNKTGILEANQQRTVLIDRIAKLKGDLLVAESSEAALSTEVKKLSDSLSRMQATTTMSETVGAGNEGADGMRQELFRLEVIREQNAAKFTDKHPAFIQSDKMLRQARELSAREDATRKESIVGPNRIYQDTAVVLEQKKPMLAAEQARIAKINEQLKKLDEALQAFTANERKFAELDRNVDIMEANYRKYFANLEQARIDTKMKLEEFSNVGIAQPATLNPKPHSPNKLINFTAAILIGIAGGLGLGVFAEYLNPSVSSDEDVEQAAGTGVVARIKELHPDQLTFGVASSRNSASARFAQGERFRVSSDDVSMSCEQA